MYTWNSRGRLLCFNQPLLMGILNLTPDSFYEDSRISLSELADRAGKMIEDGANILDLGGQSTRPGSTRISADEEAERVIPAIEGLRKHFPDSWLSVDTFYAGVARAAVAAGADLVNDVSGAEIDPGMLDMVGKLQVPYILMHIRGNPQTMTAHTDYANITVELIDYFNQKLLLCRAAGIRDIILDPGFGFAKQGQQNLKLLKELRMLQILQLPVLAGLSRKSTVWKTLGITADKALNGTTVLNTLALENGAMLLRVHDVREAAEAVKLWMAYSRA